MPKPSHRRAVFEDIEPRILYAADHPAAAAIASLLVADTAQVDQMPAQTQTQAQIQGPTELVFIDERVPDADLLANDIAAQAAAGRDITVLRIGAHDDGIAAITRALSGTNGVAAVHVISHGGAGAMQLGASTLDQDALLLRAPEIAAWGQHMSADADMLLYGCDVADGAQGQALLQGLAQLTGADVAASTDRTGAAVLGGNWLLEASTGTIEAARAVGLPGQAAFGGVLASFTVTNTNDSGAGSFRQAILDANALAGSDTVNFSIGSFNTPQTISVASALPLLTDRTFIDGASQGAAGSHNIVLDGNNGNYDGLVLASGSSFSTISGLVIRNFGQEGIQIDANANSNSILGNYIGQLGSDGLIGPAGSGNRTGILVLAGAISNTVGGGTAADRNVISGNDGAGTFEGVGIDLNGAALTTVAGNYIGTDASGNVAVGNVNAGILVRGPALSNQIGGFAAGEANVIAGNPLHNVWITNTDAILLFNNIGLGADGTTVLGNSLDGILVEGNVNGGNFTGNIIAGAGRNGIRIDGTVTNLFMANNRIGTDAAGTANWGSGQDGVFIGNTSGIGAGPSNTVFIAGTVAFSGQAGPNYAGVRVDANVTGTHPLLFNNIYASSGLGIDIGALGVQANDAGDADAGANDLQNYPLVNSAAFTAGQINLSISLNSRPLTTYTIDFFGVPAGSSGGGLAEGNVYLGSIDITTDASGNVAATTAIAAGALLLGDRITATATRNLGGGNYGGTSEFSAAATIVDSNPVITSNGGGISAAVSVAEGNTALTTVVAIDADSPTLAYSIAGGADAARFTINAGTGALSFIAAPDFDAPADAGANNVYDVVVQASDGLHTDTQAIAVTVTDVNESPVGPVTDSNTAANSVAENAANGSTVGVTAHAVDPDGTKNTVSYSLTNNAGGRFAIDASTGVVSVADGTRLDFEAAASHAITVLATSADGSTSSQRFSIALANVDDDTPPAPAPVDPIPPAPPPPSPAPSPPPGPPAPPVEPGDPVDPDIPVVPTTNLLPVDPIDPLPSVPAVPEPSPAIGASLTPVGSDVNAPAAPLLETSSGGTSALARARLPMSAERREGSLAGNEPLADAFDVAPRLADVRVQTSALVPGLSVAQQRSPDEENTASSDVDVTLVGGVAFSLGLVFWASRGSVLLASLLAAAPAWQNFDPLPVLRRRDEGRDIRDPEAQAEPETLAPSETGETPDTLQAEDLPSTRRIGADGHAEVRP